MKNLNDLPLIYTKISLHAPSATMARGDIETYLETATGSKKIWKVSMEKMPSAFHKPIISAQNKIRNHFIRDAFRIDNRYAVPVSELERFEAELKTYTDDFSAHVNAMCEALANGTIRRLAIANVDKVFAESKIEMTDEQIANFVDGFLPVSCDEVRKKYYNTFTKDANLDSPVIAKALAELGEDVAKRVKVEIVEGQKKLEADGQIGIAGFVLDEITFFLKDIQNRVGENEKSAQYETLIKKFNRITEKLPSYNVTENPIITSAIERIQATFQALDKSALKGSADYRGNVVKDATNILNEIQGTGSLF